MQTKQSSISHSTLWTRIFWYKFTLWRKKIKTEKRDKKTMVIILMVKGSMVNGFCHAFQFWSFFNHGVK